MTAAARPPLDSSISAQDFKAFYWLKEELVEFCRANGLSRNGSKQEIAARIVHFLETGERDTPQPASRNRSAAANELPALETLITADYRSSQINRAFFQSVIGKSFHFSTAFQQFFKDNVGKTFADAVDHWYVLQAQEKQPDHLKPIAPQFEYNQFTRDYYQQHPGVARSEVIRAWKQHKSGRKDTST